MKCLRPIALSFPLLAALFVSCRSTASTPTSTAGVGVTRDAATASPLASSDTPAPTAIPVDRSTYELLQRAELPFADPVELAARLAGLRDAVLATRTPPPAPRQAGERDRFWITNASDENVQISATLRYVTDNAYFWVGDDVLYDQADLEALADTFERRIYPATRSFFGSEWNPGIDGDPHIYVLYVRRLGFGVGGYFSAADSLPPAIRPDSNGHEMFVFNADNLALADQSTYGVLAHEFQHMIHWNLDIDETTWLNEGLSELAKHLTRFGTAPLHTAYTDDPRASLNDWPNHDDRVANYGAASLFVLYFFNRLGPELTQALAAHPENGLESIDAVLADSELVDPLRQEPLNADRLALDWAIANYLNDLQVADGRFGYPAFPEFRPARQTETLVECESDAAARQVGQYAPHYIRMICPGQRTLQFSGAVQAKLLPQSAFSGEYAFWSNKGDHSDMRLTRRFDLTGASGPIEFAYQIWYDIERNWDYAYLLASVDGETWDFIQVPGGTDRNPTGNNYGWGYTGVIRGSEWVEHRVDLSEYAGGPLWLRFEYLTDASVHGEGVLLDDLRLSAVGYQTDLESDEGGWQAEGWVRVKNVLPQSFQLAWITFSDQTTVEYLTPQVNNQLEARLDLPDSGGAHVLVVLPTTRFTRQPASYTLSFDE